MYEQNLGHTECLDSFKSNFIETWNSRRAITQSSKTTSGSGFCLLCGVAASGSAFETLWAASWVQSKQAVCLLAAETSLCSCASLAQFSVPVTHAQSDDTSLKQRDQEALGWLCSAGCVSLLLRWWASVRVAPWLWLWHRSLMCPWLQDEILTYECQMCQVAAPPAEPLTVFCPWPF